MVIDVTGAPPGVAENTAVPLELEERLTVSATVVGLPNGSCSWTVIGPMLAELDAIADNGFEVKTNCERWCGGHIEGASSCLRLVRFRLAERVYVAPETTLTEQPANVTTPLNWVAVQFDSAAPLGPEAMDRVTEANAVVTMLLLASSTATTGWNPKGVPTIESTARR